MKLTTRKEIIDAIMHLAKDDAIVISSPGMISREVYQVKDRPRNFYVMGSMGCSVSIGIGIALNTTNMVYVIAGDGDVLMDLSSLILIKKLGLKNITVFILNNNCYASTGGQPTCSDAVDFCELGGYMNVLDLKVEPGKGDAPRIPLSPLEIKERFVNAIKKT